MRRRKNIEKKTVCVGKTMKGKKQNIYIYIFTHLDSYIHTEIKAKRKIHL